MRSARNRSRAGAFAVAIAILALGCAVSSAQVMNRAKNPDVTEGYADWYNVPPNSLAKRRAAKDELTAAHNKLPLGTKVRVTDLANGKNVVVRITDRGITNRSVTIDLCKEAAAKLDMVHQGSVRVRLEVLHDDKTRSSPW